MSVLCDVRTLINIMGAYVHSHDWSKAHTLSVNRSTITRTCAYSRHHEHVEKKKKIPLRNVMILWLSKAITDAYVSPICVATDMKDDLLCERVTAAGYGFRG